MKKVLLLLLTIPFLSFAGEADLFKVDQKKVDSYMQDLESVEELVVQNETDYTTTFDLTPVAFDKVNLNTSSNFSLVYGDPPLGIPSFVWGLCCGFAGIGIVYFTTEDTDQTKLALYGCMTTTIVYVILYFVGAVAALGY